MFDIGTLTMNPTLDVACEVEEVFPMRKMRARGEHYDPGGGGINVARVFVRLGGNARCYYLSGGATGAALDGLLDLHQLVRSTIRIGGQTRVSTVVHERCSGQEYRFVPQGPEVAESEWTECLSRLGDARHDYIVSSGSLPRGVPVDFYAQAAAIASQREQRFVLDTSGEALEAGIAGGHVFLAKPSLSEFRAIIGADLPDETSIAEAAMEFVERGKVEFLAVTMAEKGALLARRGGSLRLPAIAVEARSAVGAGDSFLAAMVFALAAGKAVDEAFRFGLAAGAAAVLTPGTDLCRPDDVERIYERSSD
ncbi:1-phosphofructokinase family hexose kinase [Pontixanthobacter gangjinensis]|uniref:Phosphofructokinase n=1 Tax=Pontixanthobacter gangjinensis TaxID=1028742 RepID=A0A6I4SNH3_9SPHN|nr:1-phosphofructokinase family hexose kinase [Pontixanthobacter gangjinensis]MXO57264.1 hexose kinase [Pontixanthobacter gangjinensis]